MLAVDLVDYPYVDDTEKAQAIRTEMRVILESISEKPPQFKVTKIPTIPEATDKWIITIFGWLPASVLARVQLDVADSMGEDVMVRLTTSQLS